MNIPKHIGGAKVLYFSNSEPLFETVIRDEIEIEIEFLAICQYDNDGGFYLFGCDKNFNSYTDFFYDNIDEALEDAKRLYKVEKINWTSLE